MHSQPYDASHRWESVTHTRLVAVPFRDTKCKILGMRTKWREYKT